MTRRMRLRNQDGFVTMVVLMLLILAVAIGFGAYRVFSENDAMSDSGKSIVDENRFEYE